MRAVHSIAIANHKGGVAKTATAHALGAALVERKQRVLLVDVDPQASLSAACGFGDVAHSLADVLSGKRGACDVLQHAGDDLDLIPSSLDLAACELALVSRMGREYALKKALAPLGDDYDVCLLDCPPSLGLLTVNALAAAQAVIIPTMPTATDLRALRGFLDTIEQVRQAINPGLAVLGVLVTFHDGRLTHHAEAMDAMRGAGLPILPMVVSRSVRVAEASAANESILTYAGSHAIADAYRELAKVVVKWLD